MKDIKNELEKYSKKLNNETQETTKKLINEITTVLDKDEEVRGRIPEEIFVDNFLEYFKNIKNAKPEQDPLMYQWLNISGSVYNEVELIDREGNIAAVVPPLISKKAISLDKLDNVEFSQMGDQFELLNKNDGIRAYNYVATELSQLPRCIDKQTTDDDATRWLKIFKRYSKGDNTSNDVSLNNQEKEDLDINYDED